MDAALPTTLGRERDRTGAFRAVFDEHHDFVWRALAHLGVPTSGLDDAVQEVFLVVFRRLAEVDARGPLRAWLWGVARHVAANGRRGRARDERKRAALAAGPSEGAGLDQAAADRALVVAALARLEPMFAEVLVLSDVEGFSAPELAEALGLSPNTISSRLRLARERFAAAVRDISGERSPR